MLTMRQRVSEIPILSVFCSILMLILSFFSFGLNAGKFYSSFHMAVSWNGFLYSLIDFVNFSIPVILLVYSLLFIKNNLRMMVVPITLSLFGIILYTVYLIKSNNSAYIIYQWFYVLSYLSLLLSYIPVAKNRSRSKKPLITVCCLLIGLAILLTLLHQSPFAYFEQTDAATTNAYVYLSSLLYFILFIVGMASSVLPTGNTPIPIKNKSKTPQPPPFSVKQFGGIPVPLYDIKDIVLCLLFTVITGGIYSLYWMYSLCKKVRLLNDEKPESIREFLCIVFVPTYLFYWLNRSGRVLSEAGKKYNTLIRDKGISYLVLGSLGLGIVALAWMQNDLNRIATGLASSLSPNATLGLGGGREQTRNEKVIKYSFAAKK